MADLKLDTPPTPPHKKDKTIEDLLNKDNKMMRSPLLWFLLLAIPVLFAFYAAVKSDSAPDEATPVVAPAPVKAVGEKDSFGSELR